MTISKFIAISRRKAYGLIAGRPRNFNWIELGRLATLGKPYTQREVKWLLNKRIEGLLLVTEESLQNELASHFRAYMHLPIIDHTPPTPQELMKALAFIDKCLTNGLPVGVACEIGKGRSATITAACLCKVYDVKIRDAIKIVREKNKDSIESSQEKFLLSYFAENYET